MKDSGSYALVGAFLFAIVGLLFENQSIMKFVSIEVIFAGLGAHAYFKHNIRSRYYVRAT